MKIYLQTLIAAIALGLSTLSCVDTNIKELGTAAKQVKLNPTASGNLSDFTINYASLYTSGGTSYVLIQGTSGSNTAITNACGSSGTNCYCDFYTNTTDSTPYASGGGATASIQYSSKGNFIVCKVPSGTPKAVVLRNSTSTTKTAQSTLYDGTKGCGACTKALTLAKLVGDLDINYVRTIYSYQCFVAGRKKTGTTSTTAFDCTDQGANDFNIYLATYNYYVYQDAHTSITGLRSGDYIFNNGQFCGIMYKEINCNYLSSANTVEFGLYATSTEAFTKDVNLYTGPPLSLTGYAPGYSTVQGYAIPVTEFLDSKCPLGFTERDIYTKSAIDTTFTPNHSLYTRLGGNNELPDLDDITAAAPSTSSSLTVQTYTTAGDCDGTSCTQPSGALLAAAAAAGETLPSTVASGNTTFCVIDKAMLP